MTRPAKKRHERFLVEQAANLLGRSWHIDPENRENPDFVVTEGDHHFGLEVCEVFTGEQDETGSSTKKLESKKQKSIDELRRQYEAATAVTLTVKFVGITDAKNLATVVPALLAEDLASKAIGHNFVIDQNSGLRLHVTKALRADWYSVDDRVGLVNVNPMPRIVDAVEKKSQQLAEYSRAAGSDIRLLVVADRIFNSGKLAVGEISPLDTLDTKGFRVVYFFSYPESVTVFEGTAT